jgi:hypothetical protein
MNPYLKIWALDKELRYPIVKPGSVKKDFLTNTFKSHGYHCQPLSTANLHGWDFILPQDVVVIWDGISDTSPDHVKVLEGQTLPGGARLVDTSTANSTITFNLNATIETDSDHYSLLMGPANNFVQGAKPMTALIRTDYYFYNPLQFCWVITTANKPVTFKAGTPFVTLLNYPKNLLESTSVEILPVSEEIEHKITTYAKKRHEATEQLKQSSEVFGNFPKLYKKGMVPDGDGLTETVNADYKPSPKEPRGQ